MEKKEKLKKNQSLKLATSRKQNVPQLHVLRNNLYKKIVCSKHMVLLIIIVDVEHKNISF